MRAQNLRDRTRRQEGRGPPGSQTPMPETETLRVAYGGDAARFPLHAAASEGDAPKLAGLLKGDAMREPGRLEEFDDHGCTPLHYACYMGSTACVAVLLDAGASVSTADNVDAGTALHFAAWKGDWPEIIMMLLDKKANKKAKNRPGKTPLFYAKTHKHFKTLALLQGDGGSTSKKGKSKSSAKAGRGETMRAVLRAMHQDEEQARLRASANQAERRASVVSSLIASGSVKTADGQKVSDLDGVKVLYMGAEPPAPAPPELSLETQQALQDVAAKGDTYLIPDKLVEKYGSKALLLAPTESELNAPATSKNSKPVLTKLEKMKQHKASKAAAAAAAEVAAQAARVVETEREEARAQILWEKPENNPDVASEEERRFLESMGWQPSQQSGSGSDGGGGAASIPVMEAVVEGVADRSSGVLEPEEPDEPLPLHDERSLRPRETDYDPDPDPEPELDPDPEPELDPAMEAVDRLEPELAPQPEVQPEPQPDSERAPVVVAAAQCAPAPSSTMTLQEWLGPGLLKALASVLDELGVEEVADMRFLEPEHLETIRAVLKPIPLTKFNRKYSLLMALDETEQAARLAVESIPMAEWDAAQTVEWAAAQAQAFHVAMAHIVPRLVCAVLSDLNLDGEDVVGLQAKLLAKLLLAKSAAKSPFLAGADEGATQEPEQSLAPTMATGGARQFLALRDGILARQQTATNVAKAALGGSLGSST